MAPSLCPCKSGKLFDDCCGPFIQGEQFPETAKALMRSRYSAHTLGNFDYIIKTTAPESQEDLDKDSMETQSKNLDWVQLDILETTDGGKADDKGTVTFSARYLHKSQVNAHVEKSEFRKDDDGHWLYVDGDMNPTITPRTTKKVGRNEPCPCGSGKKFKKCCGSN